MNQESNDNGKFSTCLLHTEVDFWRELIDESRENTTPEILERMNYALALAEKRIANRNGSGDHE